MAEMQLLICDVCGKREEFGKRSSTGDWMDIGALYCSSCWGLIMESARNAVTAFRKTAPQVTEGKYKDICTLSALREALKMIRQEEVVERDVSDKCGIGHGYKEY